MAQKIIKKCILQKDAMDCGPSCLHMIALAYGRNLSIENIREDCFLGKDGVSLLGISRAAEKIGFRTTGGRITFDTLVNKVPFPSILHWDQNHFIVINKIRKHKTGKYTIYIADPAKGFVSYNGDEFLEHWISTSTNGADKGLILLLDPGPSFYKQENVQNKNHNRVSFLWHYFTKYKKHFSQIILGILMGAIIQLIFPFLTQAIVDTGIGGRDIDFIWIILLAQLMLLFSRTAIEFIRSKILLHIGTRINISIISDFFIKLMKLPMAFFDTKLMGDLLQRIDDHERVEQFLTSNTFNLIFSFLTFIIFGAVLFIYNITIFLIFFISSLLYGFWIAFFLKKRKQLDYKLFEQSGKNKNITYQLISGMQEIKLQGCEQRKRWEWEDVQADLFSIKLKSLNLKQIQQIGGLTINEMKNILITVLAATSVINGQMTIGMMLAVQYIIGQLNTPVEQLIQFIYSWQDVSISLERINEIHVKQNDENKGRFIKDFRNYEYIDVKVDNVFFKYDGANPNFVLNDISVTIPTGKVTAIVGASGSGKTTLIKLLLGFYSPQKGKVTVGYENLNNFNLTWWRSNCGAVTQEGYLFSDTIARNIAVSDNEPNLEKIRYAAKIANIDKDIESLPLAYNTMIGQDGQNLSQGQKQRILIARIIYKNPQFVFLDEATNALDANNEKVIVENLNDFYKGKTVVVVAHRLSTVKHADQIIVLDQGKIEEIGTHKELTSKRGKYFQLVKNQLELGS